MAAPGFNLDLAEFLQLDALPNANHSESVVGAFMCHRHRASQAALATTSLKSFTHANGTGASKVMLVTITLNGVFYMLPARRPDSHSGFVANIYFLTSSLANRDISTCSFTVFLYIDGGEMSHCHL
ncbi:Hypothetical predicted protein [Octopus vulgaris]|uniref:Uncharacterized protein n=1 Tax=Octopus vulgaris TaxID=6645 RepID=A0AA36B4N1_OCTVU|nr:Hypothetical predicted protein [Octopus vulgaris]